MAYSRPDNQTNGRLEPYGDLVDLYAARAMRARTILIADPAPLKVVAIGRGAASDAVRAQAIRSNATPRRLREALGNARLSFPFVPTHPKSAS